ncbi:MAG: hypothetical protein R6X34_23345 [Chloroflexota bacterium]
MAHETIEALRGIGLVDDIIATKEGLVVYSAEMRREAGEKIESGLSVRRLR